MTGEQLPGGNWCGMDRDATESFDSCGDPTAAVSVGDDDWATFIAGAFVPPWAVGAVFDRLAACLEVSEPPRLQRDE